jgi:hypothetical protein
MIPRPNLAPDRMTRSAVTFLFQAGHPSRDPRHRSALGGVTRSIYEMGIFNSSV